MVAMMREADRTSVADVSRKYKISDVTALKSVPVAVGRMNGPPAAQFRGATFGSQTKIRTGHSRVPGQAAFRPFQRNQVGPAS